MNRFANLRKICEFLPAYHIQSVTWSIRQRLNEVDCFVRILI